MQWAGKAERTAFDVPTVSLHTHEVIDPRRVMKAVRKKGFAPQGNLFAPPEMPLREALEFYKHRQGWQNRLVAGDSLLVMNSLIEKEAMAGAVQMIYFDPPYGIKYQSNFQPFTDKRDVKDGNDESLSTEPEMIKAFRDTWQVGIHSYLTYLRDRLLLAKDLLAESGSIFVQISDENVHRVRLILDDVFEAENFVSMISYVTTSGFESSNLPRNGDYLLWYAKDNKKVKYNQLFRSKDTDITGGYRWLMFPNGEYRGLTAEELRGEIAIPLDAKLYQPTSLISQGDTNSPQVFEYSGKKYVSGNGQHWKTSIEGLKNLGEKGRIHVAKNSIRYVRYADDFPCKTYTNFWDDTATGNFTDDKVYVVQTGSKVIARCLLMTTDPSDLVLDITCGSGTTAYVAEQWGRRWITCDTSRVAVALAKQRLMTAAFPYYRLRSDTEGVGGGFVYEQVKHITLKSIANNEPEPMETLYDKPLIDKKRMRVCSPFTVEAVPSAITAVSPDEIGHDQQLAESATLYVSAATTKLERLVDELMTKGVRGKSGQRIYFQNLELLATSGGENDLNASTVHARMDERIPPPPEGGEQKDIAPPQYAVIFGNEYTPMDKTTLDRAMGQAFMLRPKVQKVLFLAYQFDAGVHEYVEKSQWKNVDILLAQIDTDLLVEDLKKKQKGDSFWLIGQPDVKALKITEGSDKGKWTIEVRGFDYYNVATQAMESGGKGDIAMWLLDTDYNNRYLHPTQVFFPMADAKSGWASLGKTLAAEIDNELIEAYRGTMSLPFDVGEHHQVAVKLIDKRGVESMRILTL